MDRAQWWFLEGCGTASPCEKVLERMVAGTELNRPHHEISEGWDYPAPSGAVENDFMLSELTCEADIYSSRRQPTERGPRWQGWFCVMRFLAA